MPLHQKIVAVIIAFSIFALIISLLRRRKLREEYSWLWLLTGAVILILSFSYPLLLWLTRLIGAGLPTSTLFFFGLIFLVLICLQFSVRLSGLSNQVKNLTQQQALLEAQMESPAVPKSPQTRTCSKSDGNGRGASS